MLFSNLPRVSYEKNQLVEVICQLRFPTVLSIGVNEPVEFQEAIRDEFPRYTVRNELVPAQVAANGAAGSAPERKPVTNYHFISADGMWKLNVTNSFIALSTLNYENWEDFAQRFDQPLVSFLNLYRVALFDRLGLRYVNAISRKALNLEGYAWKELIAGPHLGLMAGDEISEADVVKASTETELRLSDGCLLKLHTGPGLVNKMGQADSEVKFIFDCDVSMKGNITGDRISGNLETLHKHATELFRGAVSDTLHNALSPSAL
ncbi:MAG: hypothetical protein H6Q60_1306 [Oscillospiraceae bacterium]|nr:hypothetical protein [Oscillospiraceae bacterium]